MGRTVPDSKVWEYVLRYALRCLNTKTETLPPKQAYKCIRPPSMDPPIDEEWPSCPALEDFEPSERHGQEFKRAEFQASPRSIHLAGRSFSGQLNRTRSRAE